MPVDNFAPHFVQRQFVELLIFHDIWHVLTPLLHKTNRLQTHFGGWTGTQSPSGDGVAPHSSRCMQPSRFTFADRTPESTSAQVIRQTAHG
jgi:hypothetical protein